MKHAVLLAMMTAFSTSPIFLCKKSSSGSVVSANPTWHTYLGGDGYDDISCVIETGDKEFVTVGLAWSEKGKVPTLNSLVPLNPHSGNSDMWVAKLDDHGAVQWHTFLGGEGLDGAFSVIETKDKGLVIAGATSSDVSTLNFLVAIIPFPFDCTFARTVIVILGSLALQ